MKAILGSLLVAGLVCTAYSSRIDVLALPAYGHYSIVVDTMIELARRGQSVRFACCDKAKAWYDQDGLTDYGIEWISSGPCGSLENEAEVMAELVKAEVSWSLSRTIWNLI